jgi:hypothetical protein
MSAPLLRLVMREIECAVPGNSGAAEAPLDDAQSAVVQGGCQSKPESVVQKSSQNRSKQPASI